MNKAAVKQQQQQQWEALVGFVDAKPLSNNGSCNNSLFTAQVAVHSTSTNLFCVHSPQTAVEDPG